MTTTANSASKPKPAQEVQHDAPVAASPPPRTKATILVVDDDLQIREALGKVLRAEGYEVALAADGQEALDRFRAEPVDLLVLDLNLPGSSGWDVFGTLTSANPFLPIIIITGRQDQQALATGAGVGALMCKPLDVPALLRIVTELLAESAETRLKRLVGQLSDLRHVPPANLTQGRVTP